VTGEPTDEPTAEPTGEPTGELARAVIGGDRRALAWAITLVESVREDHRARALALLAALAAHPGRARRIGVSGAPGVGKSTLVEALGRVVTAAGHRLAVLAVDPSSPRSGGSILGDKTRMVGLAADPAAFVRPSPSGASTGGVARRTREAMMVCEAAGFDVVVVETLGAGQSDTAVASMVDLFVLLVAAGPGDDLQGVKRGPTELADVVVVTKADGASAPAAGATASQYRQALTLLAPRHVEWAPGVLVCSALTGHGVAEVWAHILARHEALAASGTLVRLREDQRGAALRSELTDQLLDRLRSHRGAAARLAEVEPLVVAGRLSPGAAAARVLSSFCPASCPASDG